MTPSRLLTDLNPAQQEAMKHTDGPVLVLAGAGSGKTRVLTYRIAYILEKKLAKPNQILAVTFTNKAASEMKHRIEKLIQTPVQPLWIGTFHSISARILRREGKLLGYQSNFTIYDADDQENQIKRIMEFLNLSREMLTPRQAQYIISEAKNKLIGAREYEKSASDWRSQQIAKIFWEYETALKRQNALDFDDLILKPIDIFTTHPETLLKYQKLFRYILVDEYQDTNRAQYYWIKLLAKAHHNLCVVGDEDQSIYRWRGADIGNILNFDKDYSHCKIIRLEQNYRSTQNILDAANFLVAHNVKRLGKNLWSEKGRGDLIQIFPCQDEIQEARQVADIIRDVTLKNHYSFNDIVILYRTNAQSRALEEQMRRSVISYTIVGGMKFYERKEIKDILAYLKVIVNPRDSVSLFRIINYPSRGIGAATLQILTDFSRKENISLYETIAQLDKITDLKSGFRLKLHDFYQSIESFRDQVQELNAFQLTEKVIKKFELKSLYKKSGQITDETRLENINELLNSLEIFVSNRTENDGIQTYLEEVSLLTDIDRWDPDQPSVTLMTLHSAKGLEFPVVMITGMEDGLLPLYRNSDHPEEMEEERRLFYVGMTRAREKLYLLHAMMRHRFGREEFGSSFRNYPSRFLKEIPAEFAVTHKTGQIPKTLFESGSRDDYHTKNSRFLERLPDKDSEFKIGQFVQHQVFGRGQILNVYPSDMGTKLTVQFENSDIKKLIAEYANLTIRENLES